VTFARPEPLRARFAFQASKIAAKDVISLLRAFASGATRAQPHLPVSRRYNRTWSTPLFSLFPLFLRIVLPLLPIVSAPATFLSFTQGVAL
jgi:hypothetical protein